MVNDARTGCKGVSGIVEYLSYSLLDKLLRITGYVLRFKANISVKVRKQLTHIKTDELTVRGFEKRNLDWHFVVRKDNFDKVKNSLSLCYDDNNLVRVKVRISWIDFLWYNKNS